VLVLRAGIERGRGEDSNKGGDQEYIIEAGWTPSLTFLDARGPSLSEVFDVSGAILQNCTLNTAAKEDKRGYSNL